MSVSDSRLDLSSSLWPHLTRALSRRESWTISLQWSGICGLADWQNTTASSHHEASSSIQMDGWLAAVTVSKNSRTGDKPWANIRFPLIGKPFFIIAATENTGLAFLRWPGHGNGLLTPDLERAPGEPAQLCRVERDSPAWMVQNWYAAHIIFLSSPAWFALTLFKMEEEISLRGVSCPQVHDHSDLMCTVSAVSREGHKDQSLKVGLSAI